MNVKKTRIIIEFIFVCIVFLTLTQPVFADYVLPYPSYLPGNKLYKVSRIVDRLKAYWYWGEIGNFKYHLSLSDKYLIEAKTLFEYHQYTLAITALNSSDQLFTKLTEDIVKLKQSNKFSQQFAQTFSGAQFAHQKVLNSLLGILPKEFSWQDENQPVKLLQLHQLIQQSISIRH